MAIAMADQDGLITDCNAAFEKILGYGKEELLGRHFLDFTYAEDAALNLDRFSEGIIGNMNGYQLEKRFVRKDGGIVFCSMNASFVRDGDGKLKYNIAIFDNITDRKRTEEALRDAKMQAELYLDLMGHDINNMHQIALGYLELARNMGSGASQEFLDTSIEVLLRSSRLIMNVRKLQKLRDGFFNLELIDLRAVLEDVQREFGSATHKPVTLHLGVNSPCYVRANQLLYDVFANLVSNAIKHTGEHADIAITLDSVIDDSNGYYLVLVEDNGPGIPDDFKDNIFNRMLKGTANAKGMGLGLYLVKSLVDSYGGQVWVEDRVQGDHSQGAKFVVLLPKAG